MASRTLAALTWLTAAVCILALPRPATARSYGNHLVDGSAERESASLVAGEDGATYDMGGGTRVVLSPGSRFSFHKALKLKLHDPTDPATRTEVIQLEAGRAEIASGEKASSAVLVRMPKKVNGVTKPGGHSVFMADSAATTVAALEGDMLVGVGSKWGPLPEGTARTRTPHDPLATERDVLGAPAVGIDEPLVLVREGRPSTTARATWEAMRGAAEYLVVTRRRGEIVDRARVTEPHYEAPVSSPGTLTVTVTPIDELGLAGRTSRPAELRAVGIVAPDSSRIAEDGSVVLGRGERVTLVGADGLLVAYNSARYFMGAPREVGLARNEPTLVRLRAPGCEHEATFRLSPRGLRARVRLTPKMARWPGDRVRVIVELYDAFGRPIPEDAKTDTRVTVNLDPVRLDWKHTGPRAVAIVPKGKGRGPWIVRAEVRDADGVAIGRNFLEIAAAPERRSAVREEAPR